MPAPVLPRINDVKWQAGWPVSSDPRLDLEAPELLLEIPPEWDVLCQAAPRVAAGWQERVRRAFQAYLGRGYVVADFAPTEEAGRRRPVYVLKRTDRPSRYLATCHRSYLSCGRAPGSANFAGAKNFRFAGLTLNLWSLFGLLLLSVFGLHS